MDEMRDVARRLVRAVGLEGLGGLVLWAIVALAAVATAAPALGLIAVLLLFGQLVVVPIGLSMFRPGGALEANLLLLGHLLFRFAALSAVIALAVPVGWGSAAVASVWLLPAACV